MRVVGSSSFYFEEKKVKREREKRKEKRKVYGLGFRKERKE